MSIERPANGWNIQRAAVHPGEMLREEFLIPLEISANRLATELCVPVTRISEILHERRDTARQSEGKKIVRDVRPRSGEALSTQTSFCFPTGSSRTRLPVAANIALQIAGAIGGTPGSPTPVGSVPLSTR